MLTCKSISLLCTFSLILGSPITKGEKPNTFKVANNFGELRPYMSTFSFTFFHYLWSYLSTKSINFGFDRANISQASICYRFNMTFVVILMENPQCNSLFHYRSNLFIVDLMIGN